MNIYTCPEFRGRGVGEMLVRWLVGQAVQRNITKIYLETSGSGRKLYEKMGFLDMPDMMKSQPYGLTTGSAGGLDESLRGIFRYRL